MGQNNRFLLKISRCQALDKEVIEVGSLPSERLQIFDTETRATPPMGEFAHWPGGLWVLGEAPVSRFFASELRSVPFPLRNIPLQDSKDSKEHRVALGFDHFYH